MVEQFIPDVRLARGVRGDTCMIRVPAELIFGQQAIDERIDRACWVLSDLPTDQWRQSLKQAKYVYVQFWCVPLEHYANVGEALTEQLRPLQPGKFTRAEVVHLGNGHNYAVFACLPRMEWPILQQRLSLAGGANPIDVAMETLETATTNTEIAVCSYRAMAACDDQAIDAVDYLIAIGSPHRAAAIEAMSRSDNARVGEWLVRLVASEDVIVAAAAAEALLLEPRPQAEQLYARWLGEAVGKGSVTRQLDACATVKARGAVAHLPGVLARPHRLREFFKAMDLHRELIGRPIPPNLQQAAEQIVVLAAERPDTDEKKQQAVEAVDVLVQAEDTEAAAAIGVQMALLKPRRSKRTLVNRIGVHVLHNLDNDVGLQFVTQLADASTDPTETRQLRTLAARLQNLKPTPVPTRGIGGATVSNPQPPGTRLSGPATPSTQIRTTSPTQGTLPWSELQD